MPNGTSGGRIVGRTGNAKRSAGDPYENLANAIILDSVRSFRSARKTYRKNHSAAAKRQMEQELRFFRSRMFGILTDVDPEYLIRKLEEED